LPLSEFISVCIFVEDLTSEEVAKLFLGIEVNPLWLVVLFIF